MKKLVVAFAILCVLTACSSKDINDAVSSSLSQQMPVAVNHHKEYYRYYVPPSVGVRATNKNSTILVVDGHEVLMNLNISKIISSEYYEESGGNAELDEELTFSYEGSYYDSKEKSQMFTLKVRQYENRESAVFLNNDLIEMVAVVPNTSLNIVIESMITIMRSVQVDTGKVVAAYSTKEVIEKDAIFSQFFEQVPPDSGTLKDMYDQMNPANQD